MTKVINSRRVRVKKVVDKIVELIGDSLKKIGHSPIPPPDLKVFIDPILPKKK
jgi:hypothetical protein